MASFGEEMGRRLPVLIFKIGTLLSFCGGPLLLAELLKSQLGKDNGFMVAFLPVGLAAFGALTLMDEDRDGLAKLVIGVGGVGALAVLLSNVYAVWYLPQHPEHGDRGLITLGIVIGTVAMAWYLRMATRVLPTAPPSPG